MKLRLCLAVSLASMAWAPLTPAATPSKKTGSSPAEKAPQKKLSPKTKRPSLTEQFVKQRPKGWRVSKSERPKGVTAVIVGPRRGTARSVVSLRPWTRPLVLPTQAAGLRALSERLNLKAPLERIETPSGEAPQLQTPAQNGVQIRYILHRRGLVSIAAAPLRLPTDYVWVMTALRRLR